MYSGQEWHIFICSIHENRRDCGVASRKTFQILKQNCILGGGGIKSLWLFALEKHTGAAEKKLFQRGAVSGRSSGSDKPTEQPCGFLR